MIKKCLHKYLSTIHQDLHIILIFTYSTNFCGRNKMNDSDRKEKC